MSTTQAEANQPITSDKFAAFEQDLPKYDVAEFLARIYRRSEPTFWRELKAGKIPHSRQGRHVRFSERQIRAYLDSIARCDMRAVAA